VKTLILFAAISLFAISGLAQTVAIDAAVLAGGGGTSTGGVASVSATIGQPAPGVMTGGNVSISGAFWGAVIAVQEIGSPTLAIENLLNGYVRLSWSPNTAGFVLQEASALSGSPISWNNAPANYTNGAAIPASMEMRFFRLIKP